ncbi:hypothetical protein DL96DRAFT_961121 [Flagelloscypha sp. PMI_526]|nr:hypothetical protein DL96DRAFT_961121 [Flagelloscypha sp. PMI_526]
MDICAGSEPAQPAHTSHELTTADSGKISAYYSLVFPNFTFYIQTLDVTIGRRTVPSASSPSSSTAKPEEQTNQVDVDLGALKSVSRLHARIEYDSDLDRFVLAVLGRNGAWVDGVWAASGTRAPLSERSQIQIASRTFDFVLPPPSPPEDTPSPSSLSSANKQRSPSLDITSISPPSSLPSHSPAPLKPPAPKQTSKKRKKGEDATQQPKPLPSEESRPKPALTYSQLIYNALKSIGHKATLQEICAWIMDNYEYYKHVDNSWMSSVRHGLSSGRAFKKLERCGGERGKGKGFFWCLDDAADQSLDDLEPKPEPTKESSSITSRKAQKNEPRSSPLTYAPRAISGPAMNAQLRTVPVTQLALATNGSMGVVAYPNASSAQQTPTKQGTRPTVQPSITSQSPAHPVKSPHQASSTPTATAAPSRTPSQTPGPSTMSISIVLGPIPPAHPEYSANHPNNSKTEGYIVWHQGTLFLDPVVFGNLTKQNLEEYESMGVLEAVKVLSKLAARARRAKQSGRGRNRGRGGAASGRDSRSSKAQQPASGPPNPTTPKSIDSQPISKGGPSILSLAPPGVVITQMERVEDESSTVVIIDSDEERPAKRPKLEEASPTVAVGKV